MLTKNNFMESSQESPLSKECGFASSLVGEQKIRTISISEWIEPKVAPIAVNVFPVEMKWTGEIMIKDLQP